MRVLYCVIARGREECVCASVRAFVLAVSQSHARHALRGRRGSRSVEARVLLHMDMCCCCIYIRVYMCAFLLPPLPLSCSILNRMSQSPSLHPETGSSSATRAPSHHHPHHHASHTPTSNKWQLMLSEMAMNAALQKHVSLPSAGTVTLQTAGTEGAFVLPRGSESSQVTFAMPTAMSIQGATPSYITVNPLSTQAGGTTVPILAQNFANAGTAQMLSKAPALTFAQMTSDMQQSPLLQLAPVGYPGGISAQAGVVSENAMHQIMTG